MHMLDCSLVLCAFTYIREPDHYPIAQDRLVANPATEWILLDNNNSFMGYSDDTSSFLYPLRIMTTSS